MTKPKSKVLSLLLALALVFTALPMTVLAEEGDLALGISITALDSLPEETLWQGYDYNTVTEGDLVLPDELTGVDEDENPVTITDVAWDCTSAKTMLGDALDAVFDPETSAMYAFSPVLPEGYILAEDVTAPVISVFIRPEGGVQIVPMAAGDGRITIDGTEVIASVAFDTPVDHLTTDGWAWSGTSDYTLTINDTYTGGRISFFGSTPVTLNVAGDASISTNSQGYAALYSQQSLTITGSGNLTLKNTHSSGQAINTGDNLIINMSGNGTVAATGDVLTYGATTITGGTVTFYGHFNLMNNNDALTVSGATTYVTVTGNVIGDLDVSDGNVEVTGEVYGTTTVTGGTVLVNGSPITPAGITTEAELIAALESLSPSTITLGANITLTQTAAMGANHTLNTAGYTLTTHFISSSAFGRINIGTHTLTVNGGGAIWVRSSISSGLTGIDGTLNLENITVNLHNSSSNGIQVRTVNVGNNATINLNSATGAALITLYNNTYTLNVNSGGKINIQNFSGSGISCSGTMTIESGGAVTVGSGGGNNRGIFIGSTGTLNMNGGTLTGDTGGAVYLTEGSKIEGMNGKLKDRTEAFTAASEVTVGAANNAASPTGLSEGLYIWDGTSLFAKGTQLAPSIAVGGYDSSPRVGALMTATLGTYTANDGGEAGTHAYKWYRADDFYGTNAAVISGETAINYTPVTADFGKYICIEVTPVGSAGLTGQPTKHGFWQVGVQLTATATGAGGGSATVGGVASTVVYSADAVDIAVAKSNSSDTVAWSASPAVGTFGSTTAASTTYTPPSAPTGNITLTATLTAAGAITYPITVTSGTASPNPATAGATVTITAGTAPSGMQFKNWTTSSAGVTFASSTSATTTFSMPGNAVSVTANFEAIPATVTGVTVSPSAIEVQKGTPQQFAATVTGTNNPATTVTWSVNSTAGSSINTSGLLTVAAGETAGALTVTATSTADTSKSGTATVTVTTGTPTPSYGITLDTSGTHTFPAATAGYSAQTAKAVTITNTGNTATGALTIALSGANAGSFTLSKTNIADIANGGSDTFTVVPNTGLTAGTYTATVTVDGSNVTAQSFSVSFTVNAAGVNTYTITFNPNGGTVSETTRTITQGTAIGTLPTPTRSGSYSFRGWYTAASGGTRITAATVPTGSATYYAQWTDTSGNNNNNNSSGSGTSTSDTTTWTTTVQSDTDMPVTATITIPGTMDGDGNLTANVTEAMVRDAIAKAQAEATRLGKTADSIIVEINITATGAKSLTVKLDDAALNRLNTAGAGVSVKSSIFRFTLDAAAVKQVNTQSSGAVTVTTVPTDKLSSAAQAAIGNRPVYDFTLTDGTGKTITSYGNGTITRGINYTAASGERIGNLFAVKVLDNGNVDWITESSYTNGWLIWTGSSNSVYGVGYKTPAPAFTDTTSHWAKDNIDFVASRGLFSGTGSTTFSPDTAITRGMFVTALGRLSEQDVNGYTTSSFTDVAVGSYYLSYIEWAVEHKIVSGIGNNQFAPDKAITREEMAVMIYNYAKATNYTLPASRTVVTFTDNAQISTWATTAVKALQQAGVVSGVGDGKFNPKGTATRAEAATILRNFVEGIIDESTARGWAKNEAGQWMYWTWDGKLATGWINTTAGSRYYMDENGIMVAGKWVQIGGKWYYFHTDGKLAVSTTIDGYEVGADGARKD